MELDDMTKTIISVAVVAILVMAMAVPLISGLTNTRTYHDNEGGYYAERVEDPDLTITFIQGSVADAGTLTIGEYSIKIAESGTEFGFLIIGWPSLFCIAGDADNTGKIGGFFYKANMITGEVSYVHSSYFESYTFNSEDAYPSDWVVIPQATGSLIAVTNGQGNVSAGMCYWGEAHRFQNGGGNGAMIAAWGEPTKQTSQIVQCYASVDGNYKHTTWTGTGSVTMQEKKGYATVGSVTLAETILTQFDSVPLTYVPVEFYSERDKSTSEILIDLIPLVMIAGLMVAVVAAYAQWKKEE